MHFACSRCAHRQAADEACANCNNDVVQDLRESNVRYFLHEVESRWQRKRLGQCITVGALLGMAVLVVSHVLMANPDGTFARWPMILGIATGIMVSSALSYMLGRKRWFPYLDEYDEVNHAGDEPADT